jgi:hypothetical protein
VLCVTVKVCLWSITEPSQTVVHEVRVKGEGEAREQKQGGREYRAPCHTCGEGNVAVGASCGNDVRTQSMQHCGPPAILHNAASLWMLLHCSCMPLCRQRQCEHKCCHEAWLIRVHCSASWLARAAAGPGLVGLLGPSQQPGQQGGGTERSNGNPCHLGVLYGRHVVHYSTRSLSI